MLLAHARRVREALALVEQLLLVVGEEGKEEIMTAAEQLMERGREQGREMARREILLIQLHVLFGTLDEAVVARIGAADSAQLMRWLLRLAATPTLTLDKVLIDG